MSEQAQGAGAPAFTPGPYRLGCDLETVCLHHGNDNDYTRNGFAKAICKVKQNSWRDIEEAVATGRLLAAAPDMFVALELADGFLANKGYSESDPLLRGAIRAALAKARGEA